MARKSYRKRGYGKKKFSRFIAPVNTYGRAVYALGHIARAGARKSQLSTNRPYLFCRTCNVTAQGPIVWSLNTQSNVYNPTMGDIPNAAEFAALYDMWKLNKVVYHFESQIGPKDMNLPSLTGAGGYSSNGLNGSLKYMRVVHDYNDSTPLANENAAYEYQNMKSHRVGTSFKVTLYPRILQEVYRSALTNGYESVKPKYFDTTETIVPHYGIKLFLGQCTNDVTDGNLLKSMYTITAKYYFSCKNVK